MQCPAFVITVEKKGNEKITEYYAQIVIFDDLPWCLEYRLVTDHVI